MYPHSCAVSCAWVQVAQLQADKTAVAAQCEQLRSGLEGKTADVARLTGQLADAQAQSHSTSQRVSAACCAPDRIWAGTAATLGQCWLILI